MTRSAQDHEGSGNQWKSEPEARELSAFHRTKLDRIFLAAIAAIALACAPQAALAQHGGGGHGGGGGHSGGMGGGHWGGGHTSGGGHSSSKATVHGSGSPAPSALGGHPTASVQRGWGTPSFAPPRPGGPTAGSIAHALVAPPHETIGFPPIDSARGIAAAGETPTGAPWTATAPIRGVLSFSGQGHQIWQDEPRGTQQGTGALESRSLEMQRPQPIPPRRFHGWGPGYGYGYGWGGFYPWGLGFGFGFGPCDPLWDFNCGYLGYWDNGYGYYGPYSGFYLDSSSGNGDTGASSSQEYGANQNTAPDNSSQNSANGTAVIYLNDGTSFSVTDYWVSDYQLHYVTDGVRENVINLDQIDVQRTVDENAARGVNFTLKPTPSAPRN